MKKPYVLLFCIYFLLSLIAFGVLRLMTYVPLAEDDYNASYQIDETFLSLELEAGEKIPFVRFSYPKEDDLGDEGKIVESYDTEDDLQNISEVTELYEFELFVFPEDLYTSLDNGPLLQSIEMFLELPYIKKYLNGLTTLVFPYERETRGRMHQKKIYLYSLERIPQSEAVSVFIHEFGHYYDIYGLAKTRFGDESQAFYDISWQGMQVLKAGQSVDDFVSGYAMTNKYEDFAESYAYYVLHNAAFREKSLQNSVLAQKYAFFENNSFPQKQFYKRNFGTDPRVLPYYWDITKIDIDIENFLQYLKIYL